MIAKSLKLTSLPQDILLLIVHLAGKSDKCAISRVCKALRDVSRPTRFQKVQLDSKTAFVKFCDLVRQEEYAHCAGFVRKLTLNYTGTEQPLLEPFPRLFPNMVDLDVICDGNLGREFLGSLGGLSSLRSLSLDTQARGFDSSEPAEFSDLKLTSLSVSALNSDISNVVLFTQNVLRGATQESITEFSILHHALSSNPAAVPEPCDPFPVEISAFPALKCVYLVGALVSPMSSRLSTLLPAVTTLRCITRRGSAVHDGTTGSWDHLEKLVVVYSPGKEVDEKILDHAPNLKELELHELSVRSLHNILLSIIGTGLAALRLTSVSLDMTQPAMGPQFNDVISKDVFESAVLAMKNLEHFGLVGYEHMTLLHPIRTPFPWFTSVERLASIFSNLHFLLKFQTNMPADMLESFPNDPENVLSYVRSKRNEYIRISGNFVANCTSLQVVIWGFRKWSGKWLLIPTKKRKNGETSSVSDDIFLSESPLFDETELSSYEIV
ncbi:hypothetical protein SCHPADRAFT_999370 [Schizopora paradoxa]|uniref:F-box domain-containing protein n=1 Tax=Schizopora paradoxa TaxID=27342 RepID=A0A0H2RFZ6_9AGAM|nr:hypothetical protein SCHPADRAFT_999370 [Schizopora paradoxa]